MRLTNVAHLRLPFGRLVGYDLQVGDLLLPQLPTSEQDNKSNCGPEHTAP